MLCVGKKETRACAVGKPSHAAPPLPLKHGACSAQMSLEHGSSLPSVPHRLLSYFPDFPHSSIPCTLLIPVLVHKDRGQIPPTHAICGPLATTDQHRPSMCTCLSLTFLPTIHPPTSHRTMLSPSTHLSTHPPVHARLHPSSIRPPATSHSSPSRASPSSHEPSPVHPSVLMLGILWTPLTQGALLLGTQGEEVSGWGCSKSNKWCEGDRTGGSASLAPVSKSSSAEEGPSCRHKDRATPACKRWGVERPAQATGLG